MNKAIDGEDKGSSSVVIGVSVVLLITIVIIVSVSGVFSTGMIRIAMPCVQSIISLLT